MIRSFPTRAFVGFPTPGLAPESGVGPRPAAFRLRLGPAVGVERRDFRDRESGFRFIRDSITASADRPTPGRYRSPVARAPSAMPPLPAPPPPISPPNFASPRSTRSHMAPSQTPPTQTPRFARTFRTCRCRFAAVAIAAVVILPVGNWRLATGPNGGKLAAQETASPQSSPAESTGTRGPTGTPGPTGPPGPNAPEIPLPPMTDEAERLVAEFQASREKLADAVLELRAIQLRYRNEIDRNPDAVRRYRDQRTLVRQVLDETFDAALEVIREYPDPGAASYLLTLVQVRTGTDIYDAKTVEAASRLLDGGALYDFVFLAAARGSIVLGDFDTARNVFEALKDQELEDVDMVLQFEIERLEEDYQRETEIRAQEADDELPRVRFRTTQGDFVVELFLNQAPSTVAHFIQLVEEGFYDDLDFYQVKDQMFAMTGDPLGNGAGHAGRFVVDEQDRPDARSVLRGSLTLAKNRLESGEPIPDTGSSQFAIAFLPLPGLLRGGTTFGRVIEGMEVASQLRRVDPMKEKEEGEIKLPPDRIIEVEVIRKPDSLPEPQYARPAMEVPAPEVPATTETAN